MTVGLCMLIYGSVTPGVKHWPNHVLLSCCHHVLKDYHSKTVLLIRHMMLSFLVTVADYADADPAVVKSGRVKKAVANAVEKEGRPQIVFSLTFLYSADTSVSLPCLLGAI